MKRFFSYILVAFVLTACSSPKDAQMVAQLPPVWPDYAGVTIPAGIAPLNFGAARDIDCSRIAASVSDADGNVLMSVAGRDVVKYPMRRWRKMLSEHVGEALSVQVSICSDGKWKTYSPFSLNVSGDEIDYGLTYRLILAGYQSFGHMGLYERDLSSFRQRTLMDNRMTDDGCLNCHTPSKTDPSFSSLHVRGDHAATLLRHDGQLECLNTVTDETGGFFVYPYWHPTNKYIAYSVNKTRLSFYTATDRKLEVYDQSSDVIVYKPGSHEVLLCDQLRGQDRFETYPAFSPDGSTLYFCVSKAGELPKEMADNQYSFCSIGFDASTESFAEKIDTLWAGPANNVSFCTPRPSFDGRYVMLVAMDYGTFPLWHKEADLWLYDTASGQMRSIDEINSPDAESFHNWSSNSRWVVFSSRREDGLYTRLYLAHMDENGQFGKPFLLPQKNPVEYYDQLVYSYNIPDFTSEHVPLQARAVRKLLLSADRQTVHCRPNS